VKALIGQTLIAALAGAVAAVVMTWQRSPVEHPPSPFDGEFTSRLSQVETFAEQLDRELASDRVSLEQWKKRQTEQLQLESSDPSRESSERPSVSDRLSPSEIEPIAVLSDNLPLALSFARLVIEGSVAIHGPLGSAFLQKLQSAGPNGRLFLSDVVRFAPEERDRETAVRMLAGLQSPETVDPLSFAALRDSSAAIRGLAATALREIEGSTGRSALEHLLDHDLAPPSTQVEAWAGLLERGHHEFAPRLPRLLDRCSNSEEADLFVEALLQFGPHDLLPSIEAGVNHPKVSLAMKGTALRTLLARAREESQGYLKTIVANEELNEELREYAAQLLLVERGWDPPPFIGQAPEGEAADRSALPLASERSASDRVEKPDNSDREHSAVETQEPD